MRPTDLSGPGSPPTPIAPAIARRDSLQRRGPAIAPPRPRRHPRLAWWLEGDGAPFLRPAVDFGALALAVLLTIRWPGEPVTGGAALPLLAFPALVMLTLAARGMYARRLRPSVLDAIAPILGAVSLATMTIAVAEIYVFGETLEIPVLIHAWALAACFVGAGRIVIVALQYAARTRWGHGRRTLVVGAGIVGQRVARRLQQLPEYGLRPVGFLDASPRPEAATGVPTVPVLGGTQDLELMADLAEVEHVVVAFSAEPDQAHVDLVQRCKDIGLTVTLIPRLFEAMNDRAVYETLGGLPMLALNSTDPRGWQFAVKHAMDRVIAAGLILLAAPVLLGLALAVRLSSPGPVLFRQRRVGRDGRAFDLLKFRSMAMPRERERYRPDAGQAPGGIEGDDRRTWIGRIMRRTSLDELPQLINVVRGEMSLVGPRPERPDYVELFVRDIDRYDERHRVRAGMTGWAQIHGLRGQTSLADRVEWDNWYIEHWSLSLDLKILARTFTAALRSVE
ncbi:exopolysaccharide biosynthesis polyprenyl glycosylphosphotransferase [Paraconexibacter sp.]|uniref:exopolysaccharide biosynthesis polyprenyl glycosylphosphotransferase n=1 Tax=Paraconexibacter sp. TaxID=2949640 RepID=UPI003564449F